MNNIYNDPLNILILGVGNILVGDDGLGVRAVERLQHRYPVIENTDIIDGGTIGLELWPLLENRSHLYIIDAIKNGKEPGSISRIMIDQKNLNFQLRTSPHQLGLLDILTMASLNDALPQNIVLFGIEPENIHTSLELSTCVQQSIDKLVEMMINELESLTASFSSDICTQ